MECLATCLCCSPTDEDPEDLPPGTWGLQATELDSNPATGPEALGQGSVSHTLTSHSTVRHLSYSECHNTPQTAGAAQAEFGIYHNPTEYLVSTGYTAQSGKWDTGHHRELPVTGTPHSHLNILAMYWGGPEADEVTEPMSAMCGATHSFRISCKERPRLSSPRQQPQFHSPCQTATFWS